MPLTQFKITPNRELDTISGRQRSEQGMKILTVARFSA